MAQVESSDLLSVQSTPKQYQTCFGSIVHIKQSSNRRGWHNEQREFYVYAISSTCVCVGPIRCAVQYIQYGVCTAALNFMNVLRPSRDQLEHSRGLQSISVFTYFNETRGNSRPTFKLAVKIKIKNISLMVEFSGIYKEKEVFAL